LGANRPGLLWTCVDSSGIESLAFRAVWTSVDTHGHRLGIYGSEGWGFESLRACRRNPLQRKGFRLSAGQFDDVWSASGPRELRCAPRRGPPREPPCRTGRGARNGPSSPRSTSDRGVSGSPWGCVTVVVYEGPGARWPRPSLRRATCRELPGTVSDRCDSTMPLSSRSDRRAAADTGKIRASPPSSESSPSAELTGCGGTR